MTNTIGEFAKAKLLFCIGTNMTEAHPVAATYLKNGVKDGTKLIVVEIVRSPESAWKAVYRSGVAGASGVACCRRCGR